MNTTLCVAPAYVTCLQRGAGSPASDVGANSIRE